MGRCAAGLLAAIVAASSPSLVHAASLVSKTFHVAGVCDGKDIVSPEAQFQPWEAVPITIVGLQAVVRPLWPFSQTSYFFAGNSYSPDVMGWGEILANGSGYLSVWYPPGLGFPFPAASADPPHIDLHVSCIPVKTRWEAFYTVFYVREDAK